MWSNAPLLRLQISTAATSLGKWAFGVALYVYAFRHGGTSAIGLLAVLQALPATLAAPILGLAGDRYPRQRVLLVTNGLRAGLLALIAYAVSNGQAPWLVFALAAAFSTVSTANQPARAALIPALARSPREVSSATSVMGGIDMTSFLFGAGVGGLLLASSSVAAVVALCAVAYGAATALLLGIPVDRHRVHKRAERPFPALSAGFHTVARDAKLRLVVATIAMLSTIDGIVTVLVVVTAIHLLGIGTAGIGYLNIARGIGGLAGSAAAFALLRRAKVLSALTAGSCAVGLPLVLIGAFPGVAVGIGAWCAFGFGYVLLKVYGITLVQRLSGDRVLARVLAVLETTFVATIGIGAALAPALESLLGLRGALIAAGVALPLMTVVRFSALRHLDLGREVSQREFELLRRCPIFAPLPLATVEGLTQRLRRIELPAGIEVLTQGTTGESFYLIDQGQVEILENGVLRRRQGPGEAFGEIALLRDVPRTASVRTVAPTTLFALDREPFLVSVTGYADSHEAAHGVAQGFLADGEGPLTEGT